MALEKAKFVNSYDRNVILVQFNPSSLSIVSRAIVSQQKTQQINSDVAIVNNGGIQSRQMSISLIFDSYKEESLGLGIFSRGKGGDVKSAIDNLEEFMNSYDEVTFIWGKIIFTGCIENISTQYTMFDAGGVPVRAVVELTMQETVFQGNGFSQVEFDENEIDIGDMGEEDIMAMFGGMF